MWELEEWLEIRETEMGQGQAGAMGAGPGRAVGVMVALLFGVS